MTKEMICIVCPSGCHLQAVQDGTQVRVTGAGCQRGVEYGTKELTAPERMVTTTVRIDGAAHARLPVKTERAIPKDKVQEAMRALKGVSMRSPVHEGDVVLENAAGTGVSFIATRDL